jgi:hypothetical protein
MYELLSYGTFANSIGLTIPHRKHIMSPLQNQQVNAICRFVAWYINLIIIILENVKERDNLEYVGIDLSLCGLVVIVPGYRSRDPGSIPSVTRFSKYYWAWNGVH